MNRVLLVVLVLLGVVAMRLGVEPASEAEAVDPQLMLYPESVTRQAIPGNSMMLYVHLDHVPELGGFAFDLNFDEDVLSFVSAEVGISLEAFATSTCTDSALPGSVHVECTVTDGPTLTGKGSGVAEVTWVFDQHFVGELPLTLKNCEVFDADSVAVVLSGCEGSVAELIPIADSLALTLVAPPGNFQGAAGETILLDVNVEDAVELGGIEFNVDFDAGKFNLTSVIPGPLMAPSEPICIFSPPPEAHANFGCVTIGKGNAINGSGTIAQVELTVKAPFAGTTTVSLEECDFADVQGHRIPVGGCGSTAFDVKLPVGGVARDGYLRPLPAIDAEPAGGADGWIAWAVAMGAAVCAVAAVVKAFPRN